MKVHYINILLFPLSLNILINDQRNHKSITPHHTQTNRLLCECDTQSSNYDNDSEMKEVMQQFVDRTSQRFEEYEERMIEKRQKRKEQRDKNIQKIILKHKLEKELMDKFATLQTDIQSDAIPTCICEKSLADKVEKVCLKCTQNLGGIVAPSSGVLSGIAEAAISVLKPAALKAAARYAMKEGAAQGLAAGNSKGMEIVLLGLRTLKVDELIPGICEKFSSTGHYANITQLSGTIIQKHSLICADGTANNSAMCIDVGKQLGTHLSDGMARGPPAIESVPKALGKILEKATQSAKAEAANVRFATTAAIKTEKTNLINTIYGSWETTIIASIVAIVVIVLIMVIIYLILRYRRKKKMKKKLKYIKLLEE
ncbi:rifin [Plasmodium reichenowi]|uniref:Rifin n=1 Tax=Plasmodium reichenowi TaxID=5854 RepID=A0A060RR15_PLARE|nr:rifin [Plasmodium reichenowi]